MNYKNLLKVSLAAASILAIISTQAQATNQYPVNMINTLNNQVQSTNQAYSDIGQREDSFGYPSSGRPPVNVYVTVNIPTLAVDPTVMQIFMQMQNQLQKQNDEIARLHSYKKHKLNDEEKIVEDAVAVAVPQTVEVKLNSSLRAEQAKYTLYTLSVEGKADAAKYKFDLNGKTIADDATVDDFAKFKELNKDGKAYKLEGKKIVVDDVATKALAEKAKLKDQQGNSQNQSAPVMQEKITGPESDKAILEKQGKLDENQVAEYMKARVGVKPVVRTRIDLSKVKGQ